MREHTDCIYCGGKADSNEHLLPASLGGRLTKKILCTVCNGLVSGLDQVLSEQLSIINSQLGVHGRDNEDRQATLHLSSGEKFLIDRYGRIEPANVDFNLQLKDQAQGDIRISGSAHRLAKWKQSMAKEGVKIEIKDKQESIRYFPEVVSAKFVFGQDSGLREVARIALNFLEYYHPRIARLNALAEFKNFILRGVGDSHNYVWLRFVPENDKIANNKFDFGHRIIICLDREHQEAFGFVSFFSCIELVVNFGKVIVENSETLIVDIDPLEKHIPRHIHLQNALGSAHLSPQRPLIDLNSFKQDEYFDELERRMNILLHRVNERVLNAHVSRLYQEIEQISAATHSSQVLAERVSHAIREQRQSMLLQLREVSECLSQIVQRNPLTAQYKDLFLICAQQDSSNSTGITEQTSLCIEMVRRKFVSAICLQIQGKLFSQDWLKSLIVVHRSPLNNGTELSAGVDICRQVIFDVLTQAIGRDNFLRILARATGMEGY